MSFFRAASFAEQQPLTASFAGNDGLVRNQTSLHHHPSGASQPTPSSAAVSFHLDVAELNHAATCISSIQFGDVTTVIAAGDSSVTVGNLFPTSLRGLQPGSSSSIPIHNGIVTCLDVKCVVSPQRGGNYLRPVAHRCPADW